MLVITCVPHPGLTILQTPAGFPLYTLTWEWSISNEAENVVNTILIRQLRRCTAQRTIAIRKHDLMLRPKMEKHRMCPEGAARQDLYWVSTCATRYQ